jgi:hypothetical protein
MTQHRGKSEKRSRQQRSDLLPNARQTKDNLSALRAENKLQPYHLSHLLLSMLKNVEIQLPLKAEAALEAVFVALWDRNDPKKIRVTDKMVERIHRNLLKLREMQTRR